MKYIMVFGQKMIDVHFMILHYVKVYKIHTECWYTLQHIFYQKGISSLIVNLQGQTKQYVSITHSDYLKKER